MSNYRYMEPKLEKILFDKYNEFLKIPFENISAYLKNKPINYKNIGDNLKQNLGGSCFPLSKYVNEKLREIGFESRVIYFDLNRFWINKTIKVEKDIDLKYHNGIIIPENKGFYLLDLGLQLENPIFIEGDSEFKLKSKILYYKKIDEENYVMEYKRAGKKDEPLHFNLNYTPSKDDEIRHLNNNFYRLVPLKYSKIDKYGKKHSLVLGKNKNEFYVKVATADKFHLIEFNKIEYIGDYFNVNRNIMRQAYENWFKIHGSNYYNYSR